MTSLSLANLCSVIMLIGTADLPNQMRKQLIVLSFFLIFTKINHQLQMYTKATKFTFDCHAVFAIDHDNKASFARPAPPPYQE